MNNLQKKNAFQIPPEGSLGVLALGAVGLKAWRQVRAKSNEAKPAKISHAKRKK